MRNTLYLYYDSIRIIVENSLVRSIRYCTIGLCLHCSFTLGSLGDK